MIKKLLRAYITRRHFEFAVLLHGEVVRLPFLQLRKEQVHKKPLVLGGNDSYQNLIIVSDVVHILIHSSNERTIRKYLKVLNPDKKQLAKLNKLRVLAEMPELVF